MHRGFAPRSDLETNEVVESTPFNALNFLGQAPKQLEVCTPQHANQPENGMRQSECGHAHY